MTTFAKSQCFFYSNVACTSKNMRIMRNNVERNQISRLACGDWIETVNILGYCKTSSCSCILHHLFQQSLEYVYVLRCVCAHYQEK